MKCMIGILKREVGVVQKPRDGRFAEVERKSEEHELCSVKKWREDKRYAIPVVPIVPVVPLRFHCLFSNSITFLRISLVDISHVHF